MSSRENTTIRGWISDHGLLGQIEAIRFDLAPDWDVPDDAKRWTDCPWGRVLTFQEAEKWLDVVFDGGFGGQECPNVVIWTEDEVWYVHEYDGSTRLRSIERNPCPRLNQTL